MMGGHEPAEIDIEGAPLVGSATAQVTIVVYACARCPYCSKLLPKLYASVVEGELKGKVKLIFRTFPIRGHEGSTEGGLAFTAAARMGRFWPYMLLTYEAFDQFTQEDYIQRAVRLGLERDAFDASVQDPATRALLVASKKEGLVNGVKETPTFFFNGQLWVGELDLEELIDAAEELSDRMAGRTFLQ
jgi:protein-disulfide isomerase